MPDTASTTEAPVAGTAGQAPARRRSTRRRAAGADVPLQTLAQALRVRDFQVRGDADEERMTRSFHLPVGLIERARAASTGVEHRAYGTEIGDQVPNSFSAFVAEAIAASCTYYEDLLNSGKEFARTGRLSPGPTREGAQRGAAKRKAAAAARQGEV